MIILMNKNLLVEAEAVEEVVVEAEAEDAAGVMEPESVVVFSIQNNRANNRPVSQVAKVSKMKVGKKMGRAA